MSANPYKQNNQQLQRTLRDFRSYLYREEGFAHLPPLLHTLHFGDCPCIFCKGAAQHEQLQLITATNATAVPNGGGTHHNGKTNTAKLGGGGAKSLAAPTPTIITRAADAHAEELSRRKASVRISPCLLQVGPLPQKTPRCAKPSNNSAAAAADTDADSLAMEVGEGGFDRDATAPIYPTNRRHGHTGERGDDDDDAIDEDAEEEEGLFEELSYEDGGAPIWAQCASIMLPAAAGVGFGSGGAADGAKYAATALTLPYAAAATGAPNANNGGQPTINTSSSSSTFINIPTRLATLTQAEILSQLKLHRKLMGLFDQLAAVIGEEDVLREWEERVAANDGLPSHAVNGAVARQSMLMTPAKTVQSRANGSFGFSSPQQQPPAALRRTNTSVLMPNVAAVGGGGGGDQTYLYVGGGGVSSPNTPRGSGGDQQQQQQQRRQVSFHRPSVVDTVAGDAGLLASPLPQQQRHRDGGVASDPYDPLSAAADGGDDASDDDVSPHQSSSSIFTSNAPIRENRASSLRRKASASTLKEIEASRAHDTVQLGGRPAKDLPAPMASPRGHVYDNANGGTPYSYPSYSYDGGGESSSRPHDHLPITTARMAAKHNGLLQLLWDMVSLDGQAEDADSAMEQQGFGAAMPSMKRWWAAVQRVGRMDAASAAAVVSSPCPFSPLDRGDEAVTTAVDPFAGVVLPPSSAFVNTSSSCSISPLLAAAVTHPSEAALHLSYINTKLGAANLLRVLLSEATNPPPTPHHHRHHQQQQQHHQLASPPVATTTTTNNTNSNSIFSADPIKHISHLEATIMAELDSIIGTLAAATVKLIGAVEAGATAAFRQENDSSLGGGSATVGDFLQRNNTNFALRNNLLFVEGIAGGVSLGRWGGGGGGGGYQQQRNPQHPRGRQQQQRRGEEGTASDSDDGEDDGMDPSHGRHYPSAAYTLRAHLRTMMSDVIDMTHSDGNGGHAVVPHRTSSAAVAVGYQRLAWSLPAEATDAASTPTGDDVAEGAMGATSISPVTLETIMSAAVFNAATMTAACLSSPAPLHPLFGSSNSATAAVVGSPAANAAGHVDIDAEDADYDGGLGDELVSEYGGTDSRPMSPSSYPNTNNTVHNAANNTNNADLYGPFGATVLSVRSYASTPTAMAMLGGGSQRPQVGGANQHQQHQNQNASSSSPSALWVLPTIEQSTSLLFSTLVETLAFNNADDGGDTAAASSSAISGVGGLGATAGPLLLAALDGFGATKKKETHHGDDGGDSTTTTTTVSTSSSALCPSLRSTIASCFVRLMTTVVNNALKELRCEKGTADHVTTTTPATAEMSMMATMLSPASPSSPLSSSSSSSLVSSTLFATPAFATFVTLMGDIFTRKQRQTLVSVYTAEYAKERALEALRQRGHNNMKMRVGSDASPHLPTPIPSVEERCLINYVPIGRASALQWQSYLWSPLVEGVLVPMLLSSSSSSSGAEGLMGLLGLPADSAAADATRSNTAGRRIQVTSLITNTILLSRYAEWVFSSASSAAAAAASTAAGSGSSFPLSSSQQLMCTIAGRMYQGLVAHLLAGNPSLHAPPPTTPIGGGGSSAEGEREKEEEDEEDGLRQLVMAQCEASMKRTASSSAGGSSPLPPPRTIVFNALRAIANSSALSDCVSYASRVQPFSRLVEVISAQQYENMLLSSSSGGANTATKTNARPTLSMSPSLSLLFDSVTSRLVLLLLAVERENPTFTSQLTFILKSLMVDGKAQRVGDAMQCLAEEMRGAEEEDGDERMAQGAQKEEETVGEIVDRLFLDDCDGTNNQRAKSARQQMKKMKRVFALASATDNGSTADLSASSASAATTTAPPLLAVYNRIRRVMGVLGVISSTTSTQNSSSSFASSFDVDVPSSSLVQPLRALLASLSRAMSVLFADLMFYQRFPEDVRDDGTEEISYSIITEDFIVNGTRTDLNNAQVAAYEKLMKAQQTRQDVAISESILSPKHRYENPLETELEKCRKMLDQRPRLHATVLHHDRSSGAGGGGAESDGAGGGIGLGGGRLATEPMESSSSPIYSTVAIGWAPHSEDLARVDLTDYSSAVIVKECPVGGGGSVGGGLIGANDDADAPYNPQTALIRTIHAASGSLAPRSASSSASVSRQRSSSTSTSTRGMPKPASYGRSLTPSTLTQRQRADANQQAQHKALAGTYNAQHPNPTPFSNPQSSETFLRDALRRDWVGPSQLKERIAAGQEAALHRMVAPVVAVGTQHDLSAAAVAASAAMGGVNGGISANAAAIMPAVGMGSMVNGQSVYEPFAANSFTCDGGGGEGLGEQQQQLPPVVSNTADASRDWLLYQFSSDDFPSSSSSSSNAPPSHSSFLKGSSSRHWQIGLPLPPTQSFLKGSTSRPSNRSVHHHQQRSSVFTAANGGSGGDVTMNPSRGLSPIGTAAAAAGSVAPTRSNKSLAELAEETDHSNNNRQQRSPTPTNTTSAGGNRSSSVAGGAALLYSSPSQKDLKRSCYTAAAGGHNTTSTAIIGGGGGCGASGGVTIVDPLLSCEWTVVCVGTLFAPAVSRSGTPSASSSAPLAVAVPAPPATSVVVMEEEVSTAKVRAARLYSFNLVSKTRQKRRNGSSGGGADGDGDGGIATAATNRSLAAMTGRAERGVVNSAFSPRGAGAGAASPINTNSNGNAHNHTANSNNFTVISPLMRRGCGPPSATSGASPRGGHAASNTTNNNGGNATNNMMIGRNGSVRFVDPSHQYGAHGNATYFGGNTNNFAENASSFGNSVRSTPSGGFASSSSPSSPLQTAASASASVGGGGGGTFSFSRRTSLANITSFRRGGVKPSTASHVFHNAHQFTQSTFTNRSNVNNTNNKSNAAAAAARGLGGGSSSTTARIKLRAVAYALELVRTTTAITSANGSDRLIDSTVAMPLLKSQQFVPLAVNPNATTVNVSAVLANGGGGGVDFSTQYSQQARGSTNTVRVAHILPAATLNSARNANTTTAAPSRVIAAVTTTPLSGSVYSCWLKDNFGSQSEAMSALMPLYTAFLKSSRGGGVRGASKNANNNAVRFADDYHRYASSSHRPSSSRTGPPVSANADVAVITTFAGYIRAMLGAGYRVRSAIELMGVGGWGAVAPPTPRPSARSRPTTTATNAAATTSSSSPIATATNASSVAVLLKQLELLRAHLATANAEKAALQSTIDDLHEAQSAWLEERTNHALELNTLQNTIVHPLREDVLRLNAENESLSKSLLEAQNAIKALQQDAAAMAAIVRKQSEMMSQLNSEASRNSPLMIMQQQQQYGNTNNTSRGGGSDGTVSPRFIGTPRMGAHNISVGGGGGGGDSPASATASRAGSMNSALFDRFRLTGGGAAARAGSYHNGSPSPPSSPMKEIMVTGQHRGGGGGGDSSSPPPAAANLPMPRDGGSPSRGGAHPLLSVRSGQQQQQQQQQPHNGGASSSSAARPATAVNTRGPTPNNTAHHPIILSPDDAQLRYGGGGGGDGSSSPILLSPREGADNNGAATRVGLGGISLEVEDLSTAAAAAGGGDGADSDFSPILRAKRYVGGGGFDEDF